MKPLLSFILFIILFPIQSYGQCYCEDCPSPIDAGVTYTVSVNVSGATNNMLGSNGQSVTNVNTIFSHETAQELSLRLIAPNGSFVDLNIGEDLNFGPYTYFDIDFVQCADTAFPDCTNDAVWNSLDDWENGPYLGSYYPESGCLEDLTGTVNGLWTIEIFDVFIIEDGDFHCFNLTFEDDSGISCNNSPCADAECLAQGGESMSPPLVEAPMGDPSLIIDYTITYGACQTPAPAPQYVYYYLIFDNATGLLVAIQENVDLTLLDEGVYDVHGISILASDLSGIQMLDPNNTVFFTVLNLISDGTYCADFIDDNATVVIEGPPCTIELNATLEQDDIEAPQGDPALDPDWDITFIDPEPDPALYGFFYVVVNIDTDVIVAYYSTDDFTPLLEGNYYVVVLYYLLADVALLPITNGINTFSDIISLITNETLCADYFGFNTLTITMPCLADAGVFNDQLISECEGSDPLENTINPTYPSGNEPDPSFYSYSYIVSQNGIVLDIYTTSDFTNLTPGTYEICGLSYLTADEINIPIPDGSLTANNIEQSILAGEFCGDITADCLTLEVTVAPSPILTGPLVVCPGILYTYQIGNYTGNINDYLATIEMGSFSEFTINPTTGEYFINWISGPGQICITEFGPDCEGEVCIDVDVLDEQTITITGETDICLGQEYLYQFDPFPNGSELYSVVVSGGTILTQTDASVTILWDGTDPYNLMVELTGGDCDIAETLDLNIIEDVDFPIVTIPPTSCFGTELTIPDISGTGILIWDWSATNADINIESGLVNFTWQSIGPAEICLNIQTFCGSDEMCYPVDVLQTPEPSIDPTMETCNLTFTLEAIPSTGDSWQWESPGSGGSVSFTNQTNFITDVTVTGEGVYTFVLQEFSSNGCIGSIETIVTVTDGLLTSDPSFDCSSDGSSYTVNFDILNGEAPYLVDALPISGNTYTSASIVDGGIYSFSISDQDGCETLVEGTFTCPCITEAGTMSTSLIELCASSGEDAIGIHNGDEVFDFNDQGTYILHTNPGNTIGTILSENINGVFQFDPASMIEGQLYYISFVVANTAGTTIDFTDPCISISEGQPIIFFPDPIVNAGIDEQTCNYQYNLSINSSPSSGTWSIIDSPTSSDPILSFAGGQTFINVDLAGVYTFGYETIDANGCVGNDQVEITFLEKPQVINFESICDGDNYTISFEISGGNSPYQVNGNLISGNTFLSESISSGVPYTFNVIDNIGCISDALVGTVLCNCESSSGTMSEETITICAEEGTTINATFNNDATFDSNDLGEFIIHTGASNILGTVLASSSTSSFIYDPIWGQDITLYISHIVGSDLNGSIDLDDPCLSVSIGQPLEISQIRKVDAGEYINFCSFEIALIANDLGYQGEWLLIQQPMNSNGTFDDLNLASTSFSVDIEGNYTLVWNPVNASCTESDTVVIEFISPLQIETIIETCNIQLDSFSLEITYSGGLSPYFENGVEVSSPLQTDYFVSGDTYDYLITDSRGCELPISGSYECECSNEAGTMPLGTLAGCTLDTIIVESNGDAILDDNDIGQYILYEGNSDNIINIIRYLDDSNIVFDNDLNYGQIYFVAYVIGNDDGIGFVDFNDPCIKISNGQSILFLELDNVSAGEDQQICGLQTALDGELEADNYSWNIIEQPSGSNVIYQNSELNSDVEVDIFGLYIFELTTYSVNCPNSDTVAITFSEPFTTSPLMIECGNDSYTVSFNISGGTAPYFVDGNLISGSTFMSSNIGQGESYLFTVSDSGICEDEILMGGDPCVCESYAGTMDNELQEFCGTENVPIGFFTNLDFQGDSDDIIKLVIHTSSNNELGEIIGVFDFDFALSFNFESLDFNYGEIYYASIAVGNEGAIENPNSDPCLSVAIGTPFIFEEPILLSSGEDQIVCGFNTILVGTAPDTNVIWNINDLDGAISWDPDFFNAPLNMFSTGTYSFFLTPIDEDQCFITDTVFITSLAAPSLAEVDSFAIICNNTDFGSIINLEDQIISGYLGGRWSMNNIEIDNIIDFNGYIAGDYIISYVSTSQDCGNLTYDITITVEDCQCPEINIESIDATCFGESDGEIIITLEEGQDPNNYSIYINENINNGELIIDQLTADTYQIKVEGLNNCISDFQVIVNEPQPISVSLGGDLNVEILDSITIKALTNLTSSNIEFIQWEDLLGILNENDLELIKSYAANDSISIMIVDINGCIGMDNIMIRVTRSDIPLPNIISLNSQSDNYIFSIKDPTGIELIKSFNIYDRWGNRVHHANNIPITSDLASWNGTYNSQNVLPGVYVYHMIILVGGEEIILVGDITVI